MSKFNKVRNSVLGFVIGDAVGVPFEFKSREYLRIRPATDMIGNGTHQQPIGTWSDDSTMMFILMEWLIAMKMGGRRFDDIEYEDYVLLKKCWISFFKKGHWTPHGEAFDIGGQTRAALLAPELYGEISMSPSSQGNGALMRVLPFGFFRWSDEEFLYAVKTMMIKTCEITHGSTVSNYYCEKYIGHVNHAIFGDFLMGTPGVAIPGENTGWVVETYNAVRYSIVNRPSGTTQEVFKNCILNAINLGEDTDTVAAITGGLLGASYGGENDLPQDWLSKIVKLDRIEDLILRFYNAFSKEIEGG